MQYSMFMTIVFAICRVASTLDTRPKLRHTPMRLTDVVYHQMNTQFVTLDKVFYC